MKARTESDLDPAYESNSFEKVETSSTGLKLSNGNGDTIDREEQDNGRKLANGYSCNGEGPRNVVGPTRFNHSIITDDSQWEKDLQPLHFDTREILEETPAIFKSLSSSIRGPDTFVYLSSLKPNSLSQNDDPCKTFVITPENADFVNRKNSLNQSSPVANGYGNKTNLVKSDSNEYLSYVIEKSKEVEMKKMNESKANGEGEVKEENGADQMNGSCLTKAQNAKSEAIEQNLKNHLDSNNDFERISSGKCNSGESDTCDRKPQTNNPNSSEDVTVLSFDRTITGKKEQAFAKLQDELQKAHQELKLKDEEVTRLTRIREDVERELEELTASLFQVRSRRR